MVKEMRQSTDQLNFVDDSIQKIWGNMVCLTKPYQSFQAF